MATALWNSIDKTLLEDSGLVRDGGVSMIAEPIDIGADELLASFTREEPQWNVLEAEILVEGLEKRIAECERLREKGQDLEREVLSQLLDYQRTQNLARILRKEAADIARFEPTLLKNRAETGPVPEYWERLNAHANERAEQAEKKREVTSEHGLASGRRKSPRRPIRSDPRTIPRGIEGGLSHSTRG